jgi:hypothetical protein
MEARWVLGVGGGAVSWAPHESRGSAGGNGGTAALRSGAVALAVLDDGVGRRREEWSACVCAQVLHKLKGGVRA